MCYYPNFDAKVQKNDETETENEKKLELKGVFPVLVGIMFMDGLQMPD